MLSVSVADHLQYLTFPFELVGFTLALIEVRFPNLAARLARRLAILAQPLEDLRHHRDNDSESAIGRELGRLMSRIMHVGFFITLGIYLIQISVQLLSGEFSVSWLISQIITFVALTIAIVVILVVISLILFFTVVGGSDFATRFVQGRAVGTLGLIIASFGLLGEAYQFSVALFL